MKNKAILFTLLFILLSCFQLARHFSWQAEDGKGYTRIISGDGKGLYMYLPAIFITQDLDIQTADNRYIFKTEGGGLNKYFAGTAISMMPFFGMGYAKAVISDEPLDGYSSPFQKAVSIAALFYLMLGLFFLVRLLQLYGIRTSVICVTLLLTVSGTNLLVYTIYHPAFSHVYSFAFITMLLFYAKRFISQQNRKHLLLMTFALGMVVIIRPTNGIILFTLPFLAGSLQAFKETYRLVCKVKNIFPALLIFFVLLSIQLYLWYVQTGDPFVWSYRGEGFYFSDPKFLDVLFSFRKGFFIYTPLALFMLGGLFFIYKKSRFQFYSLLLFLFLLIYITASWWCWYYGPSYGQRPFIDFYAVFALLFAFLLNETRYKKIILTVAILLAAFNLVQSYQYVKNILSSWNMDFEKYKYVFMRTSPEYFSCLGGCDDIVPYPGSKKLLFELYNGYEKQQEHWSKSSTAKMPGEHGVVADFTGKEFNSEAEVLADSSITHYRLLYAELELEYSEKQPSGNEGPLIAVTLSDTYGRIYNYYTFPLNELPERDPGKWKKGTYRVEIPGIKNAGDHLKIYIWNKYDKVFYTDNFSVRLYGID